MVLDLRQGDSNLLLDTLPENSVDTIITDPPYGLSFMGNKWDYDVPSIELWKKCLRVLKPGGTALIFAGSRTQHRMAINVEDAGFLLKDTMMWMYGSGFPKALDISKQFDKGVEREIIGKNPNHRTLKETNTMVGEPHSGDGNITIPKTKQAKVWDGWKSHGLKPAYEPILVAVKPNDGSYKDNAEKWGVAGLNIDAARISLGNDKPREQNTKESATNVYGWKDSKIYSSGKTPKEGRFPTNVILNHTPECRMLSTKILLKGQLAGKRTRTFGGKGDVVSGGEGSGGEFAVPDTYVNKWDCSDNCPCKLLDDQTKGKIGQGHWSNTKVTGFGETYEYNGVGEKDTEKEKGASRFFYAAKASVSERNFGCESNIHPTVKPIDLMEYLCKLTTTPTGGVVLDPFMGSGATGMACVLTDRDFIGFELGEDYFKIAKSRIENFDVKKWRGQWVEEEDQMGLDEWC